MLKRYESYGDFLVDAGKCESHNKDTSSREWTGHISHKQALEFATHGDNSLVAEAEAIMDRIDSADEGEELLAWVPSVCGAYPIVPEYLAGHPQCMRHLGETGELSPVNIYVCTTCSASINQSYMRKRGAAIMALVLKLAKKRPVNLYVTFEGHGLTDGDYLQVIPIESRPLSLAHAAFALVHVGFARHLTYSIANMNDNFNGQWGKNKKNLPWLRQQYEMSPLDLYIKAASDDETEFLDPISWVNKELVRYNVKEGD